MSAELAATFFTMGYAQTIAQSMEQNKVDVLVLTPNQYMAKGGFILGVVVSSGLEVADFIFNDEKTMYDLVGGIGVEAVKGGLGAMAAYVIAGVIGSATTVAIFPLVGMAVAAFLVGTYLNDLDKTHNIKQRVIDAMKAFPDQTAQGIYAINTEAESWLARVRAGVEAKQKEVHQGLMDWLCPVCRRYRVWMGPCLPRDKSERNSGGCCRLALAWLPFPGTRPSASFCLRLTN